MRKSDIASLSTTELFCKAAEKLSFTAAAQSLGTTPSAISKAVRRLEDRLGVSLFQRTTRSIRLTEDGRAYHAVCRQALAQIEQSEEALRRAQSGPLGTLRVSLPFSYGIKRIVPLLPRYLERHQGRVDVFVSLSNALTDFVTDDFDVSIRLGRMADSRLVARRLHEARYLVVASPAYLNEHGTPQRPDDVRQHHCIQLVLPDTGRSIPWQFCEGGECQEAKLSPHLAFDHPIAALTAVLNGGGLACLLDFTVEAELGLGNLVEVLADFRPPAEPVSVVYPSNRRAPIKVRSFVDFLIDALGDADANRAP